MLDAAVLLEALADETIKSVVVAPGVYNITAPITLRRNVTLEAQVLDANCTVVLAAAHNLHDAMLHISVGVEVELAGIRIFGVDSDSEGGAVYSAGYLIMRRCTIERCKSSAGGAVFLDSGAAELDHCEVVRCESAYEGGAFYLLPGCSLLVTDSIIRENHALAYGGAVTAFKSSVTFLHTQMLQNWAIYGGGGGKMIGVFALFTECRIALNIASSGGGLLSSSSNDARDPELGWIDSFCNMSQSEVTANRARFGAGIHNSISKGAHEPDAKLKL